MASKEEQFLELKKNTLVEVYENMVYAMSVTDHMNNIIFVNPAFIQLTGYKEDEIIGKNPKILSSGLHGKQFYEEMWQSINTKGLWKGEIWNKKKDGELFLEEITIYVIKDEQGQIKNYVSFFLDITERKKLENKIKFQSTHDDLTKLPNRNYFLKKVNELLRNDRVYRFAVLFLDIDRFKDINDTLGHSVGDNVLKEIANRLTNIIGEKGIVTRYGGDSFAIILHEIPQNFYCTKIVNKIMDTFSQPFNSTQFELYVTISLGISLYPEDGENAESLVKFADSALYHAKQEGKNTYRFYRNEYTEQTFERFFIASELRKALDHHEFTLYYQPKFSCKTKKMEGFEALIRWEHPEKGKIPPNIFIPIAEETGMIVHIDQWVLYQACQQMKDWMDDGYTPLKIAVNLSKLQLQQKNLVTMIDAILEATNIPSSYLELEVTERAIMDNTDIALENIKKLKAKGIRISMDDFGVDYSSLGYLKKLPFDYLKIDQSFIRNIITDKNDQAIVKTMIQLAHHLGIKVIAEGVETNEQFMFLKSQHCDQVQGYYFDRPLPASKAAKYIL